MHRLFDAEAALCNTAHRLIRRTTALAGVASSPPLLVHNWTSPLS